MNKLKQLGNYAEQLALDYLERQGLTLVKANYSTKRGEVDLIMRQEEYLLFIEVRMRDPSDYVNALESIDAIKQAKIHTTAEQYLLENNLYDKVPCRFDVVAVSLAPEKTSIEWLKNAF